MYKHHVAFKTSVNNPTCKYQYCNPNYVLHRFFEIAHSVKTPPFPKVLKTMSSCATLEPPRKTCMLYLLKNLTDTKTWGNETKKIPTQILRPSLESVSLTSPICKVRLQICPANIFIVQNTECIHCAY